MCVSGVQLFATSFRLPSPSVHGILQARILVIPSPGDLPNNPGFEPWYPALQADSLLSEPPGKQLYTTGKNTKM